MKTIKLAVLILVSFLVCSTAFAYGFGNTSNTRKNAFGGGYTTTQSNGTRTSHTPNAFGGGWTSRSSNGSTTTHTPNAFGGGFQSRTTNSNNRFSF